MIGSKAKPVNRTLSAITTQRLSCSDHIPSRLFQTFASKRRATKPRHERPHKPIARALRRPIPFVDDVKEVQDPDEALSLFHGCRQTGFKHDYPSYAALIYKLARSRKFEAVQTLLCCIQNYNIRCKDTLFIALIQHYGKSQLPDKAIELFHQMTSFNCVRTLQSFNTLLNVLVECDQFQNANDMFNCSSKMGFRPNSVSFNIMMKGRLDRDDWEEARRLFDEMLEKEIEPTVVTYNGLIGYLCKKGDLDRAKGLLEDMKKKGKLPNAVTYALLMKGLCSLGKHKEAKKVMFDMDYQGCKPRLVNYGVLMSDLAKRGKIEDAKALLLEMRKRRFKPDVVIYNILINYLCKEGRTDEAYKVLVEMQVQGCAPNAATYRMVVDGFCLAGQFEGGLKILNAMLMSRHCPRVETFNCFIVGLVNCGKMDDACYVLEEMQKRKMKFDLGSWETLVRDTCGQAKDASGLVLEMVSAHGLNC